MTIWGITALLVLAVLIVWIIYTYNNFMTEQTRIDALWDEVDIHLKLRHALVPFLVEAAKSRMPEEQAVLERIDTLRAQIEDEAKESGGDQEEIEHLENELSAKLATIQAAVKKYPDILLNETFIRLMGELVSMEGRAATACEQHNKLVADFNNSIRAFPANIIVGFLHFHPCERRIFGVLEDSAS